MRKAIISLLFAIFALTMNAQSIQRFEDFLIIKNQNDTIAFIRSDELHIFEFSGKIRISDRSSSVTLSKDSTLSVTEIMQIAKTSSAATSSQTTNDVLLGTIITGNCAGKAHVYAVDGSTVVDQKLAEYLSQNPMEGFTVTGSSIQLPDWRGRFIGYAGALGMDASIGRLQEDRTAVNGLGVRVTVVNNETNSNTGHIVYQGDGGQQTYDSRSTPGAHTVTMVGDPQTKPHSVALQFCIVGGL